MQLLHFIITYMDTKVSLSVAYLSKLKAEPEKQVTI